MIEVSGNAAVIKGDYKLTRNQLPHGDGRWRLYDLSKDPGETTDLSEVRILLGTPFLGKSRRSPNLTSATIRLQACVIFSLPLLYVEIAKA